MAMLLLRRFFCEIKVSIGQAFEWDVQLSRTARDQFGWATRDGSHANVSLDGKITHK